MKEQNSACKILNFGQCREKQFEQIRSDLGLTMPNEKFATCAAFYAKAKRDPLLEELQMLDRLVDCPKNPLSTGIIQLDTNDAAMAETYADMMNKRRELVPDANAPMTLGEAFSLATAALERGGKERALKDISLLLSDIDSEPFGSHSVGAVGSSSLLRVSKEKEPGGFAKIGDIYLLIRRGNLAPRTFRKEMRKLVGDNDFSSLLHGVLQIGESGVLPLLLSTATGLYIDLHRMGSGIETSPKMLVAEFAEDFIAILSKKNVEATLAKISSVGMKGSVFAAVTEGRNTAIITSDRLKLIFDSAFLRNLNAEPPVPMALKDEQKTDIITHSPRNCLRCRYIINEPPTAEAVTSRGAIVSAAFAETAESPFRTAILSALTPVLALALSGGDYTEMRYAVDLGIPKIKPYPGEILAAILGIYRAQAELGIPSAAQYIRGISASHTELTVFSVAKDAKPLSCRFKRAESGVYLILASMQENGLPDFPAFRSMLAELSALARNGNILSAKVLVNESVTDALREMRCDGRFAYLTDLRVAADGPVPCAVLIESAENLPYARIGQVAEESVSVADETELFRLPEGNNLVWRTIPEAVIFAAAGDADAQILADRLGDIGIESAVFSPEEIGSMSRAMLTANTVFVCESAEWTENEQIAFARSVLTRNGGELISLGAIDPIPKGIPHRTYPNGLSLFFEEK